MPLNTLAHPTNIQMRSQPNIDNNDSQFQNYSESSQGASGLRRGGLDSAGRLRAVGGTGQLRRDWVVGDEGKVGMGSGRLGVGRGDRG